MLHERFSVLESVQQDITSWRRDKNSIATGTFISRSSESPDGTNARAGPEDLLADLGLVQAVHLMDEQIKALEISNQNLEDAIIQNAAQLKKTHGKPLKILKTPQKIATL